MQGGGKEQKGVLRKSHKELRVAARNRKRLNEARRSMTDKSEVEGNTIAIIGKGKCSRLSQGVLPREGQFERRRCGERDHPKKKSTGKKNGGSRSEIRAT